MGRPAEPIPSPPLLSPSSLPTTEGLPDVEVSMVEAADVTGVSFKPELWMQRRHWALEVLRREGVRSVLDVGAGPGALLETLIQPPATIQEAPLRRRLPTPNNASASSSPNPSASTGSEEEWEGEEPELFLNRLAALDPEPNVLPAALSILSPPASGSSSTQRRLTPLTTELWLGGIESYNQHLEGYEALVALEVIEHLDPNVLSRFGVVCLGTYRPRLLLISTPNFDFNSKFPRHDDSEHSFAKKGFVDPTGRTERVFRHSDHKLEMTSAEFASWANSAASDWGYEVTLSGVGLSSSPSYYPSDHPHSPNAPIYASQVALFRLASGIPMRSPRSVRSSELPWLSRETAHPHKLVGRFKLPATFSAEQGKGKGSAWTVRERVRGLLDTWGIGRVSLGELWGDAELAVGLCKGSKRWLVGCLGGWGDQEPVKQEAVNGDTDEEFEVEWEKPQEGGRGLVVVWKGFKARETVEDGAGMKALPPREEPSERTGGW